VGGQDSAGSFMFQPIFPLVGNWKGGPIHRADNNALHFGQANKMEGNQIKNCLNIKLIRKKLLRYSL